VCVCQNFFFHTFKMDQLVRNWGASLLALVVQDIFLSSYSISGPYFSTNKMVMNFEVMRELPCTHIDVEFGWHSVTVVETIMLFKLTSHKPNTEFDIRSLESGV
jgi:hypothetical protein